MFVESMTFHEIRKEFEKDKRALITKIVVHSKKVMKMMRQSNMSSYDKYYEYKSPLKNNWVYHFQARGAHPDKFESKQYCLFYLKGGYAVIAYALKEDRICYYDGHFFTRFFQREG